MTEPSLLWRTHLRSGGRPRGEADLEWLDQDLQATSPLTYALVAVLPVAAGMFAVGIGITIQRLMASTPVGIGPPFATIAVLFVALALVFRTWVGNRSKDQAARRATRRRRELAAAAARP